MPDLVIFNLGMNNVSWTRPEVLMSHVPSIVKRLTAKTAAWVAKLPKEYVKTTDNEL